MQRIISSLAKSFLLFAAAFIVPITDTQANSQLAEKWGPLFAPDLFGIDASNFDKGYSPQKSSKKIEQDNQLGQPLVIIKDHSSNDLQWRSFGMDYDKDVHANAGVRNLMGLPPAGESQYLPDQLRLGDSYLGIQTQKTYFGPVQSGPSDCTTNEDCADYSGLPKPKRLKSTQKNIQKPFVGLSITTPLK